MDADVFVHALKVMDADWRDRCDSLAHRLQSLGRVYHASLDHAGRWDDCALSWCYLARTEADAQLRVVASTP